MSFRAAFYKGTRPGLYGLYNRVVRLWTRGKYSHVEIVFNDGVSASASFLDGGVRFKCIDYDPAKWDFINLPEGLEHNTKGWFVNYDGAAYDYWAVLRFLLGLVPESKNKWMCSEAGMAALGFKQTWRFEPNSMYAVLEMGDQCQT